MKRIKSMWKSHSEPQLVSLQDSRSWWWTGRPGVLRFMGSQRVGRDWAAELNWTEVAWIISCGQQNLFKFPSQVVLTFKRLLGSHDSEEEKVSVRGNCMKAPLWRGRHKKHKMLQKMLMANRQLTVCQAASALHVDCLCQSSGQPCGRCVMVLIDARGLWSQAALILCSWVLVSLWKLYSSLFLVLLEW